MMAALAGLLTDHTAQTVAMGAAILGVTSGVLGSFAVLRGQSLLGDTLSHAALPGICLGFLAAGGREMGAILGGAFLTGGLAALVVLLIVRSTRLKADAAQGIVLGVFFALGVVLLTLVQTRGAAGQAGLSAFLFGQAAAMLRADLWVMGGIAAAALALTAAFWKEFKLVTFDPGFARGLGLPVLALEAGLTVMMALAIVIGLQLVGVVLMTAMLVAPAAAARQWTDRLGPMVVLAAGFGVTAGVGGAVISASARGLSTGPLVVLIATGLFAASMLFAPRRGLLRRALDRRLRRRRIAEDRVLATFAGLAAAHDDPSYPVEAGMIAARHGGVPGALRRLEAHGLIRPVAHPPEATPHWELTPSGHRAASGDEEGGR